MSYFSGCNVNLVEMMMRFFIVFSFFFHGITSSMAADPYNNPLSYELWSREEMVQMAGYGEDKLSTVLVTGTVLCEACSHGQDQLRAWPVSGASVTVKCSIGGKSKSVWARAMTDEYGDFLIDLPSQLHAVPNLDKTCLVKVLRIPNNSQCQPAYVKKQKGLRFSSVGNGIRTYSAGKIRFQHFTSGSSQACIKNQTTKKQIA